MVVFLKCSNNNRATTVYEHFLGAVDRFGLPARVRSDYGGENYLVARHMIQHRGEGRRSMLTGSSTHNQRIERLWVDMYDSVTSLYYRLFYYLEQQDLLDALNEVHLFALHYVYIPRLNQSLKSFQEGWNHHATTVYEHFLGAVDRFGLPARVRSDYGGENYLVARHMIQHRGEGRRSMLTGSSTHNQRIERLWVDMYDSVTSLYYRLFYYLEQQDLLDALNEVHLFALHYVYIPRLNQSLKSFQEGWNHHGIRTAGHLSP